jgi:ribosome-associated protein
MLKIMAGVQIADAEVQISAIRAQGAGGQNINKVASAVHLRFDVQRSSLPLRCRERLMRLADRRINSEGVIVIKAQQYRTREKNRADALQRLRELILQAMQSQKSRRPTQPTRASRTRRLQGKKHRGRIKSLRARVDE